MLLASCASKLIIFCSTIIMVYGSEPLLGNIEENSDYEYTANKKTKHFSWFFGVLFDCFRCPIPKKRRETEFMNLVVSRQESHSTTSNSLACRKTLTTLNKDLIVLISSYMDCFDVIRLSHTNHLTKGIFYEVYWNKQINNKRYVIWDDFCPKLKIYLANYFYHKGFERHPSLPEHDALERKEIIPLANMNFAKKALMLGFPKGQMMYDQALHLLTMDALKKARKQNIVSSFTYKGYGPQMYPFKERHSSQFTQDMSN